VEAVSVRVLVEARQEAWAAEAWYRRRSPAAADRFVRELRRAIALIAESPTRWPSGRRNSRRYLLRGFPFSVVYRVEDYGVCVVAVAHLRRRAGYWRDRES
jgi:plasmid stabilization system protein ParE